MHTTEKERYVRVHDFCSVLAGFCIFHFKLDMVPVDIRYKNVGQHLEVVQLVYTCVVKSPGHTK